MEQNELINTTALVFQAKSFYNAYIALEQIHLQCDNPTYYYVPTVVNGAFSIEITLKAILAKNQIDYGKEHNLFILFQLLPESFQNEMFEHLLEKAPEYKEAKKLIDELILISDAFVEWRYAFEKKKVPAFDLRFLSAFANAAIWTMFTHYNADCVPSNTKEKSDEEVEEMIQINREACLSAKAFKIQKKLKK